MSFPQPKDNSQQSQASNLVSDSETHPASHSPKMINPDRNKKVLDEGTRLWERRIH